MVNKVTLIGNLGADPETRSTSSGMVVCNLRVATSYRRKDAQGNWNEETEWHSVVVFGKTAENCQQYLSKGKKVYVEGRLQTRKWQDKEGRDRYSTEVVAHEVKFLSPKSEGQGGGYGQRDQQAGYATTEAPTKTGPSAVMAYNDDPPY
jgi:single-strand DNA-binding protein